MSLQQKLLLIIMFVFVGIPSAFCSCMFTESATVTCTNPRIINGSIGQHVVLMDVSDAIDTALMSCGTNVGNLVYFNVTPQVTGNVTVSTCHPMTMYDTVLDVRINGSDCTWNTLVACNDDSYDPYCETSCVNRASKVTFYATSGTVYQIRVGSFDRNSVGCNLCLGLIVTIGNPCGEPPRDIICDEAYEISGAVGTHEMTVDATDTPLNQQSWSCVVANHSVWFKFRPAIDGNATFSTCHPLTSYDTVVKAVSSCNELASILACNDDMDGCSNNNLASEISFSVNAGQDYFVSVGSYGGTLAGCLGVVLKIESKPDCNGNGISDLVDVETGTSLDCNHNHVPDECEPDTDMDTIPDVCDVCPGFDDRLDADGDSVPDGCDYCPGLDDTLDTDADGSPDCIDPDDDNDGMPDKWEVDNGLNPLVNDAVLDEDKDGYSNFEEYEAETLPLCALVHPQRITFEEDIYFPDTVGSQYCNHPETSKGVEILYATARIVEPSVQTSSSSHALTNRFPGDELGENKQLKIRFTTEQPFVKMKVGLESSYSFPVTATLYAYGDDTPGINFITSNTIFLGTGPTPITNELEVSSAMNDIRSIVLEFKGGSPGQSAYETIDDLYFRFVGKPCVLDTDFPHVQINNPAADGEIIQSHSLRLNFAAQDYESGIAIIKVKFLDKSWNMLNSFYVCGGPGGVPCHYKEFPFSVDYNFVTHIPEGTKFVDVDVWDFSGSMGTARRVVDMRAVGDDVNLWVRGMEITQAIQPWVAINYDRRSMADIPTFVYPDPASYTDSVPLVAHRKTVVRLYGGVDNTEDNVALKGVRAILRCFKDINFSIPASGPATITAYHKPPQHSRTVTISPSADFKSLRDHTQLTWNFVLPDAWIGSGEIYLEAEIDPPEGITEGPGCNDAANKIRITDINFNTVPHFCDSLVHFVLVKRKSGQNTFTPNHNQIKPSVDFLKNIFPIDEATLPVTASGSWDFTDNLSDTDRCFTLHRLLCKSFPDKANKLAVYALVDDQFPCGGVGGEGISYGNASRPDTFPHEVGHAVGLMHSGPAPGHGSNCQPTDQFCAECQHDWCDLDWPWPHGTFPDYGFNVFSMQVVIPGITEFDPHDIMSYGGHGNYWISSRNWKRIYNAFTQSILPYPRVRSAQITTSSDLSGTSALRTGSSGSSHILITGSYDENQGRWILEPSYEMSFPVSSHQESGSGDYCLELLDVEDNVIFCRYFSAPIPHVDDLSEAESFALPQMFTEILPLFEDVMKIRLLHDDEIMVETERSENAPLVVIDSPDSSGFNGQPEAPFISWSGSDSDDDQIYYMVQYIQAAALEAGGSWRTLAADLTNESLAVYLPELPGDGDGLVRILASDGFNTAVAISPAFMLGNHPPVAKILSPETDASIEQGDLATFSGSGFDIDEGLLASEKLFWYSSLDGFIGSGRHLNITDLSPGEHEIILQVSDRRNETASAAISMIITESENIQPQADAGPDYRGVINEEILLDGSGSKDDNGGMLYFNWSIVSAPPGSHPLVTDSKSVRAHFSSDMEGVYTLQLVVNDTIVESLADIMHISLGEESCPGDFDFDQDVDGADLAFMIANISSIDLNFFSDAFGKVNCSSP